VVAVVALGAAGCTHDAAPSGTTDPSASTAPATAFVAGSPWTGTLVPVALPAPVNSAVAVACPTATACWAVGSTVGSGGAPNGAAVIATGDGGATWHAQPIPATVGFLSAIACITARQCVAMGQGQSTQGIAISTTNGGLTWVGDILPADVTDVTAVACQVGVGCAAVGATTGGDVALTTTGPTAPWSQAGGLPAGVGGVRSLSCVGSTDCWATGELMVDGDHVTGEVLQTTTGGSTWLALPVPAKPGFLNGVSCVAGPDDAAGAIPTTSTTTVPATTVPAPGTPTTVAPATTTSTPAAAASTTTPTPPGAGDAGVRCTVVGTTSTTAVGVRSGQALVLASDNGGATWASEPVTASAASLLGVSCTAVATCVAVGNTVASAPQAGVIIFTGATARPWSPPTVLTPAQSLTGVDCVSTAQCVVVGESLTDHLSAA
jgi:hypothetical protein